MAKAQLSNVDEEMAGENIFQNGKLADMIRQVKKEHMPVHRGGGHDANSEPVEAVPKKQLLSRYLTPRTKGRNKSDTVYLPPELSEVFLTVWERKRREHRREHGQRYDKSFLIIEALFLHPEILEELREQGLMK
jgi:hypothetical protein